MTKQYAYKLTSYNASFSLREYSNRYTEKQINDEDKKQIGTFFAPPFQRNTIWTPLKQSKLIETFLIKLPVPPVFLYKNNSSQHEIIDGYQRIYAIKLFLNNNLKLTGLESKYNGMRWVDFSEEERADFETKMMHCIIVENMDSDSDRTALYEVFARLNSGGTNLNNMEVRRAIGWGKFLSDIETFNRTHEWRSMWGTEKTANRYEDIELILRIIAFSEKIPNNNELFLDKPMKEFLDNYLEYNKDKDKTNQISKLKTAITHILSNYINNKPFHKGSKINYALADSIIPTIMNCNNIENIDVKLKKLICESDDTLYANEDEKNLCREFQEICFKGQGSISKAAVKKRREITEKILCGHG